MKPNLKNLLIDIFFGGFNSWQKTYSNLFISVIFSLWYLLNKSKKEISTMKDYLSIGEAARYCGLSMSPNS
jgi:hypothetical protein